MSVPSAGSPARGKTQGRQGWQGQTTSLSPLFDYLYKHRLRQGWTLLLFAALALFAWLVWLLLFAPERTSFVVLTAAPYSWPLAPNAWSQADVEKLAHLDRKNISLRGAEEPVLTKTGFLDRLEQEIQLSREQSLSQPLVVYVSMHGVSMQNISIHGTEDPPGPKIYLIPPHSSPSDAATWIDFDELMDRLTQIEPQRSALLILDCQRMQVNWNIGLLANQFSARVQQRLQRSGAGKLAVLLAASAEEISTTSSDLQGSTFGHYLRQGLAGAADLQPGSGDHDGWVSLRELQTFLKQRVNQWAIQNRGIEQTPLLLTSREDLDFHLTRSLNREALAKLVDSDRSSKRTEPNIVASRLDSLWRQLEQLRERRLYQWEPVAWRNLEHRLLWLEQLSVGGPGYRQLAARTLSDIEGQLQEVGVRLDQQSQTCSIQDSFTAITGDTWPLPNALKMHSEPLSDYFGAPDTANTAAARDSLVKFREQPTPELLAAALPSLVKMSDAEWTGGRFLRMLDRYQFPGLWARPQAVRQLLNLQHDISNLAVPRDALGRPSQERVHVWTRRLLTHVQVARRQAEDCLFVQDQPGLDALLSELHTSYQESASASGRLAETLAISDRALAETPYLAQWLAHPRQSQNPLEIQAAIDDRLLPLIVHTQALSRQLAQTPEDASEFRVVVEAIHRMQEYAKIHVSEPLDALASQWSAACNQLLAVVDSDAPETAGELEAVLSVPFTKWESRRDLRTALDSLEVRLHENYDDRPAIEALADSPTGIQDKSDYSARLAQWERHPLLAILGLPSELSASEGNPLENLLDDIAKRLDELSKTSSLTAQQAACSEAAQQFRAAAPLWFSPPRRDPIAELRQLDLQSLLIWHAQSSLDDCWGPAGQELAFFDVAAADYLEAVEKFAALRSQASKPSGALEIDQPELEGLNTRLAAMRRAAATWISTRSEASVQLAPGEPVRVAIAVNSAAEERNSLRSDAASDNALPPSGTAAVFIRGPQGQRYEASLQSSGSVALPQVDTQLAFTLAAALADSGEKLQALAMFRGHEYSGSLNLEKLGGVAVDVNPYRYESSEVTLNSPWQKLSVVFILDCSQSMQNSLGSAGASDGSRLDVAQAALQELLIKLSLQNNVRVGVQLFGHRLGWSTDAPVRPLKQPDLTTDVPAGLSPSRDVESVLQLGAFNLSAAQAVIPRINGVKPWGQSPLYLSVMQALDDFGSSDADADRHIIVITDGANYQYIPESEPAVQATTESEVRRACSERGIPLHILGLGMERSQDRQTTSAFTQLCYDTGGRFQGLTSSTDLTQALHQLLAHGNYRLGSAEGDADAEQLTEREAPLGSPIRLSPAPRALEQHWLSYEGRAMVDPQANAIRNPPIAQELFGIEGGESLRLFVNEAGDLIHAYPFDDNVAAQATLLDSLGAPTDHVVRMHQPIRENKVDITFPISWQHLDTRTESLDPRWRITQRPAGVWVEVQPLSASNLPIEPAYVYFDENYEAEQPVPSMNFVARNWPPAGKRAQVRLWCQPPPTSDLELQAPMPAPAGEPTADEIRQSLDVEHELKSPRRIAAGVTLRRDEAIPKNDSATQTLRFVLEFDDVATPVTSIKLSLSPQSQTRPTRIVRQFDAQHRLAVHTFSFESGARELPKVLVVTNRELETQLAWRLERETVILELPEAGNFLPVRFDTSPKP